MFQAVDELIKKFNMIAPGQTIVVGVSGGPDSMALLHYLCSLRESLRLTIVASHVDHQLRGKESQEDLAFVAAYCRQWDVPFSGKAIDVAAYKKQQQLTSTQVAARECRYAFFKEVMASYHADALALAHHGDDQIETMLMRMTRGSSSGALAGIAAVRPFHTGVLIRPFLGITKEEIEHYCKVHSFAVRQDATNDLDDYTRNRFRHYVLPFLKKENPNVHKRFQVMSETISEDEAYMIERTEEQMKKAILVQNEQEVQVSVSTYLHMPIPLQKRAITLILNYLYKQTPSSLSSVHKESFLALLNSDHPSGQLHFPQALHVVRSYDMCSLHFLSAEQPSAYEQKLFEDQVVDVPGGTLSFELKKDIPYEQKGKDVFVCDVKSVILPLTVRTRKPGDRMIINALGGTRKVKDIFIDEKVDRTKRDQWPILVDGSGAILWIPNVRHAVIPQSDKTEQWVVLQFQNSCQDV
ncbi:tRNA(Ile)-lysidine synthetase [Fictibacillus macauensis ZFHKF-1]|uniref:tRNA(Ile)-lysidine synthase n=1 Tax=Fictibacillus macauensis ZFHKF-1 TaxID=1196324 RepID=I8AFM4_9BACL|nr:tRNA lysidine(34) synthetase TilS [Fictibacillus macauensis]EIT84169.1 tRNA(Ile)-lysidine synthetase [Fictibacillus macauensis ZFHKF-1]